MAYCVVCGNKNDDDARFCVSCGAELNVIQSPDQTMESAAELAAIVTPEDGGEIVETAPEVKAEAHSKRGRKKKEAKKEEQERVEKSEEEIPPEEQPAETDGEISFSFDPKTPNRENKQESDVTATEEVVLDSPVDETADTETKEAQPESIGGYIPPSVDVYRPQYASSPYSEPTRIGESININTSLPPGMPNPPVAPSPLPYTPPTAYASSATRSAKEDEMAKPVSTAGFFWLNALYLIPGVGLLMSIILSFAAGNRNVKNHARASLIIRVVIYIIFLVAGIVLFILELRYGILSDGRDEWYSFWHDLHYNF